ncbi:MAG: sulfatase-like hydrolase/transferase [Cellulophaga sp.]
MRKIQGIKLILKVYLLVLPIFSVFRIILFITGLSLVKGADSNLITIIKAFLMGMRFDTVVSGYILLLPAIIVLILDILNFHSNLLKKFVFYWIFILFTIAFIVCSADIPYFNQFYSRFTIGAFAWMGNPDFVFSMIVQEAKYFLITIPFILLTILYFIFLKRIFRGHEKSASSNTVLKILVSLTFLGIVSLGIRGRLQIKSPIRVGTAYFSNNSFLNKLGLNPVFTLIRSYLDSKDENYNSIQMIDEKKAIQITQQHLNLKDVKYDSPIAREIIPDTIATEKPNIVLVLMESMSAAKMKRHGNKDNLTPFLDSLSLESYYFENIYSAGKHTYNGVFSTLCSFPALYSQHAMKQTRKYDGISTTLLKHDYSTTYFTTHDGQYDNMEGFLKENDFEKFICQRDYPFSEIKTILGVPDDYMFRHSLPILNKLSEQEKPFFVTLLTTSDHGPYFIPEYFTPKSKKVKLQAVEYADWSLKQFFKACEKETWFDNTIFVFLADHGSPMNAIYDIALNYHHSPLIIHAPKILKNKKVFKNIGSQIDVFPTLMGLLKLPYINNTLGIDLLKDKRAYALINDDDKIGILDTTNLLILKDKGSTSKLYKYREKDTNDYKEQNKEKALEMEEYARAHMQTFQYMLTKNKTKLQNK